MALSVIGAGFGRTGTLSLKTALEKLGFGPCYHTLEIVKNPGFEEPWYRAAMGEQVDWDEIFRGYRSTVDWPSAHFYGELAAHFPDAKIILTVRDAARWIESCEKTIFPALRRSLSELDTTRQNRGRMARKVVFEQALGGNIDDPAQLTRLFESHIETVKRTILPERLLVYEVAQGWEPLCAFLGVPMPDAPFPRVNEAKNFTKIFIARY